LILDGTYFTNDICLVVYRNSDVKCTQLYRLSNNEHYLEIREDLENLNALNIQIESITCDGHRAILKAIKKAFKDTVPIQRCLVHIQRMSRIWLTKEPKSIAGKQLLQITQRICSIETELERQMWLRSLYNWDLEHRDYIKELSINPVTGQFWYKHKMLRRVRRMLINAFPNMFHYLEDRQIPKSTNALESFFGHLKDNLSVHRGLSIPNRKNFIKWYMYFRNYNK
jgi:transposase-like protein